MYPRGSFFSLSPYSELDRQPHLNFLFLIDDVVPFVSHFLTDGRVLALSLLALRFGDWNRRPRWNGNSKCDRVGHFYSTWMFAWSLLSTSYSLQSTLGTLGSGLLLKLHYRIKYGLASLHSLCFVVARMRCVLPRYDSLRSHALLSYLSVSPVAGQTRFGPTGTCGGYC